MKIQNLIQIIHGDKTVLHVILVGHEDDDPES